MRLSQSDYRRAYLLALEGNAEAINACLTHLAAENPVAGAELRVLLALHVIKDRDERYEMLADAQDIYSNHEQGLEVYYAASLAAAVRMGLDGRRVPAARKLHRFLDAARPGTDNMARFDQWMRLRHRVSHKQLKRAKRTLMNVDGVVSGSRLVGFEPARLVVVGPAEARRFFRYLADVWSSPALGYSDKWKLAHKAMLLIEKYPNLLEPGEVESSIRRNLVNLSTLYSEQFLVSLRVYLEGSAQSTRFPKRSDDLIEMFGRAGSADPSFYVRAARITFDDLRKRELLLKALQAAEDLHAAGDTWPPHLSSVGLELAALEMANGSAAHANSALHRQREFNPVDSLVSPELSVYSGVDVPDAALSELLSSAVSKIVWATFDEFVEGPGFSHPEVAALLDGFSLNEFQSIDLLTEIHEKIDGLTETFLDVRPGYDFEGRTSSGYTLSGRGEQFPVLVAASNYLCDRLEQQGARSAGFYRALTALRIVHGRDRRRAAVREHLADIETWNAEWRLQLGVLLMSDGESDLGSKLLRDLPAELTLAPDLKAAFAAMARGRMFDAVDLVDRWVDRTAGSDNDALALQALLWLNTGEVWRMAELDEGAPLRELLRGASGPRRLRPAVRDAEAVYEAAKGGLASFAEADQAWSETGRPSERSVFHTDLSMTRSAEAAALSASASVARTQLETQIDHLAALEERNDSQNRELLALYVAVGELDIAVDLATGRDLGPESTLKLARALLVDGRARQSAELAESVAAVGDGPQLAQALMVAGSAYQAAGDNSTALDCFERAMNEGEPAPQQVFEILFDEWRLNEATNLMLALVKQGDVHAFTRFLTASRDHTHRDSVLDHLLSNDMVDVSTIAMAGPRRGATTPVERIAGCSAIDRAIWTWTDMGTHDLLVLHARKAELLAPVATDRIAALDQTVQLVEEIQERNSALALAVADHVISTADRVDAASDGRCAPLVAAFLEQTGTHLRSAPVLAIAAERCVRAGDKRGARRCSDLADRYTSAGSTAPRVAESKRTRHPTLEPLQFGVDYPDPGSSSSPPSRRTADSGHFDRNGSPGPQDPASPEGPDLL